MIRLSIPSIEENDLQAVKEVLQSGYLVQGPKVAAFERPHGTEFQVLMGKRIIGLRKPEWGRWRIFPPFRLIVPEHLLPGRTDPDSADLTSRVEL